MPATSSAFTPPPETSAAGDVAHAFGRVWPHVQCAVESLARALTDDRDERDDLIQEARVELWRIDASRCDLESREDLLYLRRTLMNRVRVVGGDAGGAGKRCFGRCVSARTSLCRIVREPQRERIIIMPGHTTWEPHTEHGKLSSSDRDKLPESAYAFPTKRKEPITDASHVKAALARFDQVEGVSDSDRDLAFRNIKKAAKHYGIDVEENDWHQLGKHPHTKNASHG